MRLDRLCPALLLISLAAAVGATGAAELADTGQSSCFDATGIDGGNVVTFVSTARDLGDFPRQDCRYGPDAAVTASIQKKTGAGDRGFDYTKIANNGSVLPASAVLGSNPGDWACTRDNRTGLTWEVKTASASHLRAGTHNYVWLDDNPATNGGNQGYLGSGNCGTTLGTGCRTYNYRVAVNTAGLCGASDWRMPSVRELFSLVHFGNVTPRVDANYFPNTAGIYWTAASLATDPTLAWYVSFSNGQTSVQEKSTAIPVRLVRGPSL